MKLMTKIDIKNHIDCITQRIDEYNGKKIYVPSIKIRMQNNWVIVWCVFNGYITYILDVVFYAKHPAKTFFLSPSLSLFFQI